MHVSTEVNTLRDHFTKLSDDFMTLATLLQRYADFVATDPTYYTSYLGTDEQPATDITPTEFTEAIGVLSSMASNLTRQQRVAIAKMRR